MDGKMPDLGLILSSLSATKVCTLSLVRLTVVLKTYSEVWYRYVFFQYTGPRYALGLFYSENSYK
jgi:hypothetical protein